MRSGILLAIVGAWLVLRTVRTDASGQNLVDRILGGGSTTSSAAAPAPAPAPRTPSVAPSDLTTLPPLTRNPPAPFDLTNLPPLTRNPPAPAPRPLRRPHTVNGRQPANFPVPIG